MTPDDIRKLADCLPFAEQGHGLEQTQAALRVLAEFIEAFDAEPLQYGLRLHEARDHIEAIK